jgi:phospholipid/cholesterol/gamma-HCH transport system substrate-binding protein
MDLHYKQEVTVGALVLVAVSLFIVGTMWLSGRSFSTAPPVVIMFPDAGTLKRGSPVRVSGVTMGTVESIVLEDVGKVRVAVSLSEQIQPKADATARLASIGLVGDVVIKLDPGKAAEPLGNRVIQGSVEQGITDIGSSLSEKAGAVLTGLSQIEYKRLADELTTTLVTFQQLARTYANTRTGPMADLTLTMESFRTLSARFDSTLASANIARAAESADSLMNHLSQLSGDARRTSQRLDSLLAKVNRGEGSLGRLVSDTAFYDNAQKTLRSLQEFVDDLRKHPGKLGVTVRVF